MSLYYQIYGICPKLFKSLSILGLITFEINTNCLSNKKILDNYMQIIFIVRLEYAYIGHIRTPPKTCPELCFDSTLDSVDKQS